MKRFSFIIRGFYAACDPKASRKWPHPLLTGQDTDPVVLSILVCITAWISSTSLVQAQPGESPLRMAEEVGISITGVPAQDQVSMAAQSFIISKEGVVRLAHLREGIRALGLTPIQPARKIERAYKATGIYNNPIVNVSRAVPNGMLVVTAAGNVRKPGLCIFRTGMKLSEAIAERGGFNDSANPRRVRLDRWGGTTKEIDMRNIRAHPENNLLLEPGDEINVPSAASSSKPPP